VLTSRFSSPRPGITSVTPVSAATPYTDHLTRSRDHPGRYRLFTTILDPAEASATELAATYHQRWEIELAFDELKTHQRGPRTVLRSKSPTLVQQEIWGHLCCHYAIRSLMAEAAVHAGHDPDRMSFVAALRIARATIAHEGDFPP
jgi:IS4 transposase